MERLSVEGTVVDVGTGSPLPTATVVVDGTASRRFAEAVVDGEGRFRIELPPASELFVTAQAPGFVPATEMLASPHRPGIGAKSPLRFALARGGLIRGTVRGPTGWAPQEGLVFAEPRGRDPAQITGPSRSTRVSGSRVQVESTRSVPCDAQGRFEVDGVPFDVPFALAPAATHLRLVRGAQGVIVTREAPEAVVELELGQGATVEVEVVDEQGEPVPGAELFLGLRDSAIEATTDAHGRATLAGAEMTPYTAVYVRAAGFVAATWHARGRTTARIPLDRPRELVGRVEDDVGTPVLNAHVAGEPCFERLADVDHPVHARATTGRNGTFVIAGVSSSPVDVRVSAPGHADVVGIVADPTSGPLEIVLPREVRVTGRLSVDDAPPETWASIVPAVIERKGTRYPRPSWDLPLARKTTHVWDEGRFDLGGLPARPVAVWFLVEGRPSFRRVVSGRPGETIDLGLVRVPAWVSFEGRVVDEAGDGVGVVGVRWVEAPEPDHLSSKTQLPTPTDERGRFHLERFPDEGGLVLVHGPGRLVALARVDAANPTIVVRTPVPVRGQVVGEQERTVSFRAVFEGIASEHPIAFARLEEGGRFRTTLRPGPYLVHARVGMREAKWTAVEVRPGEPTEVVIG